MAAETLASGHVPEGRDENRTSALAQSNAGASAVYTVTAISNVVFLTLFRQYRGPKIVNRRCGPALIS
jgi:hypothetical protein